MASSHLHTSPFPTDTVTWTVSPPGLVLSQLTHQDQQAMKVCSSCRGPRPKGISTPSFPHQFPTDPRGLGNRPGWKLDTSLVNPECES